MHNPATRAQADADIGNAWLRHQTAQLRQRHLQLGGHFHLDVDALLIRARPSPSPQWQESACAATRIRRATIEAIDFCAQLASRPMPVVVRAP